MKDTFGRDIDYLRISLTDRCNLRCVYCMPEEGVVSLPHEDILRIEEFAHIIEVAASMGIRHIRLTGGEPLVRKGVVELVQRASNTPGIESVALTTNATLLTKMAPTLQEAGLTRVNISLDSLDAEQFHAITRRGNLADALEGIQTALDVGFHPVKINTVVVRRLNQDLLSFARMTLDRPLHVRFIEYMPVGEDEGCGGCGWGEEDVMPAEEILSTIDAQAQAAGLGSLSPVDEAAPEGWGPARYYTLPNAQGTIGVISAISNHFCNSCNRLRLTADGKMKPCLFSDEEIDIRTALRTGTDEDVRAVLAQALNAKPEGHHHRVGTKRMMSQVGG